MQQETLDDFKSLDIVFEQTQWAFEEGYRRSDVIDTKCAAVLGASSFLLAGEAVLQSTFASHPHGACMHTIAQWLAVLIAVSFFVVVVLAGVGMRPREWSTSPIPSILKDKYLNQDPREAKLKLMNERLSNIDDNAKIIKSKTSVMVASFFALAVEAVLLSVVLILAAVNL